MEIDDLNKVLNNISQPNSFTSLRYSDTTNQDIAIRQGVANPITTQRDRGVMVTVFKDGGIGYGATSDMTEAGIHTAMEAAHRWAELSREHSVMTFGNDTLPHSQGSYETITGQPWDSMALSDKLDFLQDTCKTLKSDQQIVDWHAGMIGRKWQQKYVCTNGSQIQQTYHLINPHMMVVAHRDGVTQSRSAYGRGYCRQGGIEVLNEMDFAGTAARVSAEALELVAAPSCPSGEMDVILAPDQMILQIHESIGHPLELDRILGDERNYAGTSFVTPDMFGNYQYGSQLLNITFDPSVPGEFASYSFDDDGAPAHRTYIIEKGILKTGLGGSISQKRLDMPGVANSRATSWNRPPIDRMANLNLEAGETSLDDMISSIEKGVMMHTNCSWSIDDSRNKFQFGCEYGRLIENGALGQVVRTPNYRGISASFWRNLKMVGDRSTMDHLGSPFCGKGEPNQVISVGHASPACLFSNIDVFGGDQ